MEILLNDKMIKLKNKDYFVASENPYYIGIIVNPSSDQWGKLVEAKSIEVKTGNSIKSFKIPYRIDVGENSIFFITAEE
ncbi:MAG: hypothetical protein QXZ44_01460 [Ferroplasma sp.]